MIKAKNIQKLYTTMGMCESSLDYIVMYKEFLEDIGINTSTFGINKIIINIVNVLSDTFDIKEIEFNDNFHCETNTSRFVNIRNISYMDNLEYPMEDKGFKLVLQEPPFNIETLTGDDNDFILGIKYIEFEDGKKIKLSELGTFSNEGELSELDTFFSMINFDIYNEVMDIMNTKCSFISYEKCSKCDYESSEMVDDYINIINKILLTFLE